MGSEISAWGVKGKAGREAREEGGGKKEVGVGGEGCLNTQPLWVDGQALPSSYSP